MLKMVKRSRKGVYTANIKFLGARFGGRLTNIPNCSIFFSMPHMKNKRQNNTDYQNNNNS